MGESGDLDCWNGAVKDGWVYKCSTAPAEPREIEYSKKKKECGIYMQY